AMIGAEELADGRVNTRLTLALRFHLGPRAAHLVHVGRRTADVADDAGKLWVGSHFADFLEHGFLRTRLNDSALVSSDRAKGAAAETAAHDSHRILDHLVSGYGFRVRGVRTPCVRQVIDVIHL